MKNGDIIQCTNCKGKGHVLLGISLLCPLGWFLGPFETNDKDCFTRETCSYCHGKGYVKIYI